MRRRRLLWAAATLSLMGLSALLLGWHAARLVAGRAGGPACAGDFRDYRVGVALEDGAGITLPAGTRLRLRFCEYNAQARLGC